VNLATRRRAEQRARSAVRKQVVADLKATDQWNTPKWLAEILERTYYGVAYDPCWNAQRQVGRHKRRRPCYRLGKQGRWWLGLCELALLQPQALGYQVPG
jgi:hypothetical protein